MGRSKDGRARRGRGAQSRGMQPEAQSQQVGLASTQQCTQDEERTQTGCGFTLSNGRIGVAEPISELNAYAISTVRSCRLTSIHWQAQLASQVKRFDGRVCSKPTVKLIPIPGSSFLAGVASSTRSKRVPPTQTRSSKCVRSPQQGRPPH